MVLDECMRTAWPLEKERCSVVECSEAEVHRAQVKAYQNNGWERIAPLFGCDRHGTVSERAAVPRVYATIKGKCIPAAGGAISEIKARPITPHTKVVLKKVYNKVASAYLYVLTQLRNQRTCRLWNTQEYVGRASREMAGLRRQTGRPLKQRHVL